MDKSKSLEKYFKSIQNLNPLTISEEQELGVRIKSGDRNAINLLVQHNLKIVVTIANRNQGRGILIDDLIQQGNIGLYEAALRYDPESGNRFTTYARTRILKKINELIDTCGRIVRIPVNQEYQRYLDIKNGKDVDNLTPIRLDSSAGDESNESKSDRYQFQEQEDQTQSIAKSINLALDVLDNREREVITLFFGLETGEKITQIEIGKQLGLTNVTIGNIKKKALAKIKQAYSH